MSRWRRPTPIRLAYSGIWLTNSGQKDPAFQARYQPRLRPLKQDVVGEVEQNALGTDGSDRHRPADGVRQRREPAAGTSGRTPAGVCDSRRSGRELDRGRAAASRREPDVRSSLGGALGVGLAYGGLRVLVATGPSNLPRLSEISIDSVVLGFALTISLLSGFLFGLMPILKYARPRLADCVGGGRGAQPDARAPAVATCAGRGADGAGAGTACERGPDDPQFPGSSPRRARIYGAPPRADVRHVDSPNVCPPMRRSRLRFSTQLLDKVAAIPGVASAAFTTRLPTDPSDRWSAALSAEDKADDGRTPPNHQVKVISPGMFDTLGTPLVVRTRFHYGRSLRRAAMSRSFQRIWPASCGGLRRPRSASARVNTTDQRTDRGARSLAWRATSMTMARINRRRERFIGPHGCDRSGYQPGTVSVVIRTERAGTESLLNEVRQAVCAVHRQFAGGAGAARWLSYTDGRWRRRRSRL